MRSASSTRPAAFEYVNKGGYYHSLPGDPLREFIDTDGGSAARDGL